MSVINQMLQDLDKRKQRPGDEIGLEGTISPVQAPPRSGKRRAVWLALGATAAVTLAVWSWSQQGRLAVVRPGAAPALMVAPIAAPLAIVAPPTTLAPAPADVSRALPPLAVVPVSMVPNIATPKLTGAGAVPPNANANANASAKVASEPLALPPVAAAEAVSPRPRHAKSYTPTQLADNMMGEAQALDQQGRVNDAKALLERALKANPQNLDARQMLIQLHIDSGRQDEARPLLAEGLQQAPERTVFSLTMARLQLDGGETVAALKTLQSGLPGAGEEPQFHATLAALQLRQQRYDEAVKHYIVALRSDPAFSPWLVGVGLAFEGLGRGAEATEAYRRADSAGHGTTPELARFVEERLAKAGARAR